MLSITFISQRSADIWVYAGANLRSWFSSALFDQALLVTASAWPAPTRSTDPKGPPRALRRSVERIHWALRVGRTCLPFESNCRKRFGRFRQVSLAVSAPGSQTERTCLRFLSSFKMDWFLAMSMIASGLVLLSCVVVHIFFCRTWLLRICDDWQKPSYTLGTGPMTLCDESAEDSEREQQAAT